MDFYQRFNCDEYIRECIYKFTENFHNEMMDITSSPTGEPSIALNLEPAIFEKIFERLKLNSRNYDLMVSRQEIYQSVDTLKDIIKNASKLENDPANPELILTARGIGYMFQRIS